MGDGIIKFDENESLAHGRRYEDSLCDIKVCKFVPASGAASRMFKDIGALRDVLRENNAVLSPEHEKILEKFSSNIKKFPFYALLEQKFEEKPEKLVSSGKTLFLLDAILGENGLGYEKIPKGLVPFHKYGTKLSTAFCEHFKEAIGYISSRQTASMHFTIPPDFAERFVCEEKNASSLFSFEEISFKVTYSIQDPETDTIAVSIDNTPITKTDGSLLKRPAGHGALLKNLNELSYDCVFIKNIDNVSKEEFLPDTIKWKKTLGGFLLSIQKEVFRYAETLHSRGLSKSLEGEITSFFRENFFMDISRELSELSLKEKKKFLFRSLNRPIRVCGVVRNEGEPGGGPFWVRVNNRESLQIVESAEIDQKSLSQRRVWESSTHFNPVDIVCGVKNFKGEKFNLFDFADPEAGILTEKTFGSGKIKALELPGLWNGSMSGWITVFAEVPSSTFNPVKTLWDLLKEPHQVGY